MATGWMVQKKDETSFDYRSASCVVPFLSRQCLKDMLSLFNGISRHVVLRSDYDDSLMFCVEEESFHGFLNTSAKAIRHYQAKDKLAIAHQCPMRVFDAMIEGFEWNRMQIGVFDKCLIFTDVDDCCTGTGLNLNEAKSFVAWCYYDLLGEMPSDESNVKAFGYVDGVELLKGIVRRKENRICLACDNSRLWVNEIVFKHFEEGPQSYQVKRVSLVVPRRVLSRVLLRLCFVQGLRTLYLHFKPSGIEVVSPDVVFFIYSAR